MKRSHKSERLVLRGYSSTYGGWRIQQEGREWGHPSSGEISARGMSIPGLGYVSLLCPEAYVSLSVVYPGTSDIHAFIDADRSGTINRRHMMSCSFLLLILRPPTAF